MATDILAERQRLQPTAKANLIDLLAKAGHSTLEWSKSSIGDSVARPSSNPRFCYEWAFKDANTEDILLCVWYSEIEASSNTLVWGRNLQSVAKKLMEFSSDPGRTQKDRNRAARQAARSMRVDSMIRTAFESQRAVRFIINDGNRVSPNQLGKSSSSVHYRLLDPRPWWIHQYNKDTGECLVVRDVVPEIVLAEQKSEACRQMRAIEVRRGQAEFRARLLQAWSGRCAVTGCAIPEILEAAHITPHAERADYRTSNGLLLRADIHTLFDLGLLRIDANLTIHVVPSVSDSEYRTYDGRTIERLPASLADRPSITALLQRFAQQTDGLSLDF